MAISGFRGARVKRIEDPRLLTGQGTFVDDVAVHGAWHAVVVRSPHAHARIRAITGRGGEVVTARDLGAPVFLPGEFAGSLMAAHPVLAADRVCYVGQPVALVVAGTRSEAVDLAAEVEVDYEPLPPVVDPEAALRPGALVLHPDLGTNIAYQERWRRGAVTKVFQTADVTVSQRIRHQRLAAISLEGRAVLAVPPQEAERTLTVWSSTQMPHALRDELVARLPDAGRQVRVVAPDVGGGFGAKINIYPEEILIPLVALRLGRPVKWIEDRREHLLATSHGRSQWADVRIAASRAGRILALQLRVIADVGAYLLSTTAEVPTLTLEMATGPYDISHVDVELLEVYTSKAPTGAYRGAGRPEATFYLERALDILAADLRLDPVEIRRRNFISRDRFPYHAASGAVYDSGSYAAALDRAVQESGYTEWRQRQASARGAGRLIGIGVSSYVEQCAFGADASRVELDDQGKVTAYTGTSPHGQGGATGFAQIIADALGVGVQQVTVVHGDTALIPEGEGTAGSRTMVVGGSAIHRAAVALRRKVLERAARRLEAHIEDLVLSGGRVFVAGVPAHGVALGDLVGSRGRHVLSANGQFTIRGSTFPFGTHVTVVEVDPESGEVQILQHVAVDDCGVVVNPLLVEGQIHGGVAQAIGQALYEEVRHDDTGQVPTGSLLDYAVPRASHMPWVVTARTETPSPRNPLGVKGVGEAGTIGATPAVVNAVLDALAPFGVRHLDMPLTPVKVWRAIQRSPKIAIPR